MGILNFVKTALFPPNMSCILCDAEIAPSRSGICGDCALPYNSGKVCQRCGTAIEHQGNYCMDCPTARHEFDQNRSALLLTQELRSVVHRFKYGGALWLAPFLAEPIAATIIKHSLPADVLLPVPMHPDRQKRRGYNQAAALAQELSLLLDVPVADDALVRTIDTPHQARHGRAQRLRNLVGAFSLVRPELLKGKNVLIIDDVFTTGSTIDCCAKELKRARPAAINSATLATPTKISAASSGNIKP